MNDKYTYDDANPTYRIINQTFVIRFLLRGRIAISSDVIDLQYAKYYKSNVLIIKAKCMMYSHIKLLGVLRPIDKRVYLN